MTYKKFFAWYSPVFIICLGLACWLMYYLMFLKDNFTLTTAYIDEMAYSKEEKYFIEVNYFPNMFEAKINYYTDVEIPQEDENGNLPSKYTYSTGVQFDGGYQYEKARESNWISYKTYYNKMKNCTYYNTTDNGTSYTAITKLSDQNHWVYDVGGQLCKIEEKGDIEQGKVLWVSKKYRFDTALMLQDLYKSVKSLEDGTRVVVFDLSKYYKITLYNENTGKFDQDIDKTTETLIFVNIKVNKSSNQFVSANQSMFGKFKGDPNWTKYDFDKLDYWRARNEYNLNISDFTFVYENGGYYLKLQSVVADYLSPFVDMKYIVIIDLDKIYLGNDTIEVKGFTKNCFGSLGIDEINLTSSAKRSFEAYYSYNFNCTGDISIVLLGGAK